MRGRGEATAWQISSIRISLRFVLVGGGGLKSTLKKIGWVVGLVVACMIAGAIGSNLSPHTAGNGVREISYADFIAVMLTAISVLLTILAFILAIAAYIGWNNIESKAKKTTEEYLGKGFEDGNELHQMFERYAQKYVWRQASLSDEEFDRDAAAEDEEA